MAIQPIAPKDLMVQPAEQHQATVKSHETAQKAEQKHKSDSVTISKEAAAKAAEAKETPAPRHEKAHAKK
jgi:hypothetical protein